MKKIILISFLLPLSVWSQNTVCLTIEVNPNPGDPALADFVKYVDVLGCISIYAETGISDDKILHAAAIAAELLDNDENGVVDDASVGTTLTNGNVVMPLFASEGSPAENSFFSNFSGCTGAVLYNNEIDPTQPGHWGDDATVEEILHTINNCGQVQVYPAAFGLAPNSSIMSDAMDVARGGQYLTIPAPYPAAAWYHYDDATCDYECMTMEYFYWSLVSHMGILDDPSTCAGIANEWEPCSPSLFQSTDVAMYNLITDPQYKLPLVAPDGNYCPSLGIIEKEETQLLLFPNPADSHFNYTSTSDTELKIISINGNVLYNQSLKLGQNLIDVSALEIGIHFVVVRNNTHKLIIQH